MRGLKFVREARAVVVQVVNFEIPVEVYASLASGDLVRYGGVVRDLEGHIVKHLEEVLSPDSEEAAERAIAAAKKLTNKIDLTDPRLLAGAIVIGVATIGGTLYFLTRKPKSPAKPKLPEWVVDYNASLTAYLKAVQDGTLDAEIVDRLICHLEALKEHEADGQVILDFSTEQAEQLVNLVVGYTRELAKANSVDLNEIEDQSSNPEQASVIDMRHYLEVQRRIFNDVA